MTQDAANLMRNNSFNASKPENAYLLPTFDVTIPVAIIFPISEKIGYL
jgi:hypothetical protein